MQLSIREAAGLLHVREQDIYRWLDDGILPACRVGDEVRFNRAELLEWATLRKLPLSSRILEKPASFQIDGEECGTVTEFSAWIKRRGLTVRVAH